MKVEMKKSLTAILSLSVLSIFVSPLYATVDGTTGTPLGGLGTGAVKFCASNGTFFFNDQTPTRYGDYQLLANARFQLFTKRNAVIDTVSWLKAARDSSGRIMDDAIFPMHQVIFDAVNDIEISLNAFAPFLPANTDAMTTPCAFYEFSFVNSGSSEAEVSIAFQMTTSQNPVIISGKGLADQVSQHQKCVFVYDSSGTATVSVGGGNAFYQSGICENSISGNKNRAAASFKIPASGTRTVTFIFGWYNNSDPPRYYYTNLYKNVLDVADTAESRVEDFKQNVYAFVDRMRASNLPTWLIDQTLNSLINIVNNSIYTADGRYCHNEGMYLMDGTMDQMWHARQINIELLPDIAWKELEYWARCQKKSAGVAGQIHHDFGSNSSYTIANWDETEYSDYRDINDWVDLNCGFIINVYETYIATADQAKLTLLWPYVKKAGQRILDQVALYGDQTYPCTFSTSKSSYDAGGNSQAFNSGLSIVAYKILNTLALKTGELSLASKYDSVSNIAITNFSKRWLEQPVATGNYCESMFGGPWIANFLKMDQFWPSNKLDNLFFTIVNFYNPLNNGLGYPSGSYSDWQTYLVSHIGGYALQNGHNDIWYALQHDMYERNYLNRNLVFNEQLGIPSKVSTPNYLAADGSGSNQYISIPVVWRNYFDVVGFHRNKVTGELWLEPNLPPEVNHTLVNASVLTPEGYATISATESGTSWQNQLITFASDQSIHVDTIYVKDKYADSIQSVFVNGVQQSYDRIGTGHQKRLKIYWSGTVGPSGLNISVVGNPVVLKPPTAPGHLRAAPISPSRIDVIWQDNATDELGYRIESKIGGVFTLIGTVGANDTIFSHNALLQNTQYTYRVSAFNNDGISGYSNETTATTYKAGNGDVVFAVNAGGPAYAGKDGIQYATDIGASFCSGGTSYSTSSTIRNTDDGTLYQSERYGNFIYTIPIANDKYEVTLKFAEIYWNSSGSREFNVTINDSMAISSFDIFKLAGPNSAYDVTIPITVTNGTLKIAFITIIDNAKLSALAVRKAIPSGVHDALQRPFIFSLSQNYPNPFNPTTIINYTLPRDEEVVLKVYNILGREVAKLVNEHEMAGIYSVKFDGSNCASGIYFYRIHAGNFISIRKMLLIK
jgi:uncharacterized protein (DUF608 family)